MRTSWMQRVMALACAVGVIAGMGVQPAGAAFPGRNGKIAYDIAGTIRSIWANGTGSKMIVGRAAGPVSQPAWSADGKRLTFVRQARDHFTHIWVKDMATGRQTQVTSNPRYDGQPAWSPDGTKIAFVTATRAIYTIGSTRPFGARHLVFAAPPEDFASDPVWSADGTKIAFEYYDHTAGTNIAVVPADGSSLPVVLTHNGYSSTPAWSPDGTKIAYSAPWLNVMNADGTGNRSFVVTESDIYNLAWSPDGTRIAAAIDWQYTTVIITMNPQTGAWIKDDVAANVDGGLDWQPLPA